jgi:hypothetical protein
VSPVKYEQGFYIPEDDILHSHSRENLKYFWRDLFLKGTRRKLATAGYVYIYICICLAGGFLTIATEALKLQRTQNVVLEFKLDVLLSFICLRVQTRRRCEIFVWDIAWITSVPTEEVSPTTTILLLQLLLILLIIIIIILCGL